MPRKAKKNAQGAGTIRKRSDGRWEARYTVGFDPVTGKQKQKSIYGKTQREVRERLAEITTELDNGTYIEPSKNTVGEWLDTWVGTYAQFSVKPYTLDAYQRICHNYLTPALGTLRLSELTAPHIQRFYNSLLMERGLSPKTVRNIHGVLHRALEQAMKLGMLRSNPTELCDLPKARRKEIRPMEQDKIGAFLQEIKGSKYELLYLVTLFTGMRQGEVLGLTWDCVDFTHNTLYINKQLQKTKKVGGEYALAPTKNSRARVIIVAASVLALLKQQKSRQEQAQLLAGSGWDNRWGLVFTISRSISISRRLSGPSGWMKNVSTIYVTAMRLPPLRAVTISKRYRATWATPPPASPWTYTAMSPKRCASSQPSAWSSLSARCPDKPAKIR